MSIHIGDYKKDTGHLRAAGHGAYFLLIMHYWSTGGLPDDDRQLAAISCMSDREWKQWKPIMQAFFHDGWKHKRIDVELVQAHEAYAKRAAAGGRGGAATRKPKPNGSNAEAMLEQTAPNAEATLTLTNKEAKASSRASARESGNSMNLKEESEARKAVNARMARVLVDTPQWVAWQKYLTATKGKGSPYDKQGGWYFKSEWPPGHQS
ncbi:MAG TPA: DUF1376 domain-containing protein [Steroidobacteraceae bacterium]|nr:DUF1376 domain-containing protein [Steroidobacteraceae bacterium]